MSDPTDAPAGAGATALVPSVPATTEAPTPSDLGRMLAGLRNPKPDDAPEAAAPEPELAPEANAAPPEEAPSETQTQEAEPAAEPPIERPRSWTKDVDDVWQTLPRALQEKVAAREQEREREIRRSQNEAAEKSKAIQAEIAKAEQARKEYEAKLPALMETLRRQSEFADIRSMDDVKKLQLEDPFRFQQWQIYQMDAQAAEQELQQAKAREATERQTKWTSHVQEENAKFAELVPEFADPVKAEKLTKSAVELLHDKGFSDENLSAFASGQERLSIYDHRLQSILFDALKYREAQKAKPVALPKPVPQVQRPGVAPPKSEGTAIQALSKQHERTGSVRDLGALIGGLRRA